MVAAVERRTGAVSLIPRGKLNTRTHIDPLNPPRRIEPWVLACLVAHFHESRNDPPDGSMAYFSTWVELHWIEERDVSLKLGNEVEEGTAGAVTVNTSVARGLVPLKESASERVRLEVALYQRRLNNRLWAHVERARSPTAFMEGW